MVSAGPSMAEGSMGKTMKALTLTGYDGLASMRLADVAMPEPGPDDVLVAMRAATVNPIDGKISSGYLRGRVDFPLPHVLGRDGAGVVAKLGSAVTGFAPGDEVYGVADQARWGTQAEFVVIPAATLARRPPGLSDVEAGSLPMAGLSAYAGLVSIGKLQRGERVLIHAGAGGIGAFAVQLAKHLGATVAATAGTDNVEFVCALGADLVIDYGKSDFSRAIENYDLVFDLIGGEVRYRSFRVLKPGGRIVHISVPPMKEAPPRDDVTMTSAPVKYETRLLDEISALVAGKAVRPVVGAVFPFADALAAYRHVMTGHGRGRVMLDLGC
jgi:NADPH:quinone reductase-like Zn-dependent oxidoreductase